MLSTRKILVLKGHPGAGSLNGALAAAYAEAALSNGHAVRVHDLAQMRFDMDWGAGGYRSIKPLEPDLDALLADLEWSEHVVIAMPLWWGAMPAKLKGALDRILLPGRAFDPRVTSWLGQPKPLLTGKTARILLTSDTPDLWLRVVLGGGLRKIFARQIFGFTGIRPTGFTNFAPASHPGAEMVRKWQRKAAALGARAI